jgi:hypothetical protein
MTGVWTVVVTAFLIFQETGLGQLEVAIGVQCTVAVQDQYNMYRQYTAHELQSCSSPRMSVSPSLESILRSHALFKRTSTRRFKRGGVHSRRGTFVQTGVNFTNLVSVPLRNSQTVTSAI